MSHHMKAALTRAKKAFSKKFCADGQPKEPAFERVFQKIQKLFDEAQVKYHKDSLCHLVSATKALAVMQKRFTRAFIIHQKKSGRR